MLQVRSPASQIKTLQMAHSAATVSKTPVVINGHVLIPTATAAADELNGFYYEAEISGGDKATGALAVGAKVYWDATAKKFTATATDNTLAGYAIEAADSAATVTGLVAFNAFAS